MPAGRRSSYRVVGAKQIRGLARDLRRQADSGEQIKRLRRELREETRPFVPAIRGNILALPSKNQNARRGQPSLRAQMARAVSISVRTAGRSPGVVVFINPRLMPAGKRSLPGYFERVPGKERLRHPVFQRQDASVPWVTQRVPPQGFFTSATSDADRRVERAGQRVIDQMAREIED